MTTILKDLHGEPILWTEIDENGEAVICDERECTPLYGDDPATAAAEWIQTCSVDWASVTPCIAIPGIAWMKWGDDVIVVRELRGQWVGVDGMTWPTARKAIAHALRDMEAWIWADDDDDEAVIAGREIVR